MFIFYYSILKRHFTAANNMSAEISSQNYTYTYTSGVHSVAYVTTPNEDVAKTLAHGLVSKKLAACVNIIPRVTSVYEWEGKINEDPEVLMMIKTRTSKVKELTEYVKSNHPYTVCEVIALPIAAGNEQYLKWLGDVVPST